MALDDADYNIFAALVAANGFAEHAVGLAYAGSIAQKHLEQAALLFKGDVLQPLLRRFLLGLRIVDVGRHIFL